MTVPQRIRTVLLLALLTSVGIFIVVRCWSLRRPANDPKHPSLAGMCDFQDVVYYPTRAAFAGVNPYDARAAEAGGEYLARYPAGNEFSPYAPLLFLISAPLAALPLTAAEFAFCALNLTLLAVYAYVLLRLSGYPPTALTVMGLATFLLLSRPGHSNYYFGQTTVALVLATLGGWWLAESRPWSSSVWLAISLIKPTFGGPLLVLMLLRGYTRAAVLGVALAVVANVGVLGTLLPQHFTTRAAITRLIENQTATDEDPAVDPRLSASRIDFPFVVERMSGQELPSWARYGMTLLLLAVTGWQLRRFGDRDRVLATGFAMLTIAICIYHNIYDALLLGVSGAATWRIASAATQTDRRLAVGSLILLLVPGFHYFSSRQFLDLVGQWHPSLADISQHASIWTFLSTLNGLSLTAAWCLLLVLIRRSAARPSSFASESPESGLARSRSGETLPGYPESLGSKSRAG